MLAMKFVPVLLVVLSGCLIPDSEGLSTAEQQLRPPCDDWGCGTNSPYVEDHGFSFLYANGAQTPQGFAISQFEKNGVPYAFRVINGEISGRRSFFLQTVTISGGQLIGAKLHLTYNGTETFVIRIAEVKEAPMWATLDGGNPRWIESYVFEWLDSANEWENVCSHPGDDDTLGMNEFDTLVFEGDIIDAQTKVVAPTTDKNVVNFGCAGSALAKMQLTGHTQFASKLGFATTATEKTTMLKLIVGDYCGTGKAFTVGGQVLQWADNKDWMKVSGPAIREAQWSATGATCLNTPRLLANPPPINTDYFPSLLKQIENTCNAAGHVLPHCATNASAYEPDAGFHLISSNPT